MGFKRKPRLTLADIDDANTKGMLQSWTVALADSPQVIEAIPDFGLKEVAQLSDEEIAELLGRKPGTRMYHLAASVQRTREAWRGPARWSLVVAALSFAVALTALIRTF